MRKARPKLTLEQLQDWLSHETFAPDKTHLVFISRDSGLTSDDYEDLPGIVDKQGKPINITFVVIARGTIPEMVKVLKL